MTTGKKSLYLLISMVLIIFGYIFLFFGNEIGKNKHKLLTEFGIANNLNEHYMTIESWIYDPDEGKMEIVIGIDNKSYDGNDTYMCQAISRKNNNIQEDIIVNTRDILVIHLSNVPKKFGEISLRIYYDEFTELNPLKLYTNQNDVVTAHNIVPKKVNQYYVERNERLILSYQEENRAYSEVIDGLNTKIENATISISDLEKQFGFKTDAEVKELEIEINGIQTEISGYQREIKNYQDMISENESRISNCIQENKMLTED